MEFAGQRFKPSAKREREITRVLRDSRVGTQSFQNVGLDGTSPNHIVAKNSTGTDLAFGQAVQWDYINYAETARREWNVSAKAAADLRVNPSVGAGGVYQFNCAITIKPIKAGEFGIVAINGPAYYNKAAAATIWLRPSASTVDLVADVWGCCRVLAVGSDYSIVDLSQVNLVAPYKITGSTWTVGPPPTIGATISPDSSAPYSAAVADQYGIAAWQTTDDRGMATWDGTKWVVTQPFCLN